MNKKLQDMVLASIFIALIIMMTIVPYTGYISYGPIEITTLHIVVILGAIILGPSYGALLGGVWGLTCIARAFTNPLFAPFTNPLVSLLPRILVGLFAGLVFKAFMKADNKFSQALAKKHSYDVFAAIVSTIIATLTNTILVLTALNLFGGSITSFAAFFELLQTVYNVIIGINFPIEIVAAIIIVPSLYKVFLKVRKS